MLTPERTQQIQSIAPMYRAFYYGQRIISYDGEQLFENSGRALSRKVGYLSLRSVESLAEEELTLISEIAGIDDSYEKHEIIAVLSLLLKESIPYTLYLHLSSIGIALPYFHPTTRTVSVPELIEAGVVVINPNQPV